MQQKESVKFRLSEEHVRLIEHLHFVVCADTEYGDSYIPGINRKRPFGNSGTTESALEILGYQRSEDGCYKKEDIDHAETLLVELPVAMEVIAKNRTFEPGSYEVSRYGAYSGYVGMRNYKALKIALNEVEETLCETERDHERFIQLKELCMNVSGEDPWKIICDIEWGASIAPQWEKYLSVFRKYKAVEEEKRQGK